MMRASLARTRGASTAGRAAPCASGGAPAPAMPALGGQAPRALQHTWGQYSGAPGQFAHGSFSPNMGVSVERQFLGQNRRDRAYKPKKAAAADTSDVVTVNRHFGVRELVVGGPKATGALDAATLRAVRKHLELWEGNPAVSLVVVRSADTSVFSAGVDLPALKARVADPATREEALGFLRELYYFQWLVASYTKPIVTGMSGVTLGAGLALGLHARFPYALENSTLASPEAVDAGLVPSGGLSYYLSRLPGGTGMFMALTGAHVKGEDAFWAGLAPLFGGDAASWAKPILEAGGAVSSDPRTVFDMDRDPVYKKMLHFIREHRADSNMYFVSSHLSEDVSQDIFRGYVRLKRWHLYMAAGDRASAMASYRNPELSMIEDGELFDFGVSDEIAGRDRIAEPGFVGEDARARFAALAAHSAAMARGALAGTGAGEAAALPSAETAVRSLVVREAFAGDVAKGDAVVPTAPAPAPAALTRAKVLAQIAAAPPRPLPGDWEVRILPGRLPSGLASAGGAAGGASPASPVAVRLGAKKEGARKGAAVPAPAAAGGEGTAVPAPAAAPGAGNPLARLLFLTYDVMETVPNPAEVLAVLQAVRTGVPRAWPSGVMSSLALDDVCHAAGVPERQDVKDVVSRCVSLVVGRLLGLKGKDQWLLVDPALLAREEAAKVDADRRTRTLLPDGFELTPRLERDLHGLYYDFKEEDVMYPFKGQEDVDPNYALPLEMSVTADSDDGFSAPAGLVSSVVPPMTDASRPVAVSDASWKWYSDLTTARLALRDVFDALGVPRAAYEAKAAAAAKEAAAAAAGGSAAPSVASEMAEVDAALFDAGQAVTAALCRWLGPAALEAAGFSAPPTATEIAALTATGLPRLALAATRSSSVDLALSVDSVPSHAKLLAQIKTKLTAAAAAKGNKKGGLLSLALAPEEKAAFEDAVAAFVAAEARLLVAAPGGSRSGDAVASWATPDGDVAGALNAKYTLAAGADGKITLVAGAAAAKGEEAGAAKAGAGKAAPGGSPLDRVAPASLPSAASLFDRAVAPATGGAASGSAAPVASSSGPRLPDTDFDEDYENPLTGKPYFDAAHVRAALTDANTLVASFGLPNTPDTVAAAARAVDSFKAEADGRVAVPQVASVAAIKARLAAIVARGEPAQAAVASAALAKVSALPAHVAAAVHALVTRAATLSLPDCMALEYRAMTRLMMGPPAGSSQAEWEAGIAANPDSLFAPLPEADLTIKERGVATRVAASRKAAFEEWASQLDETYESGFGKGVLGDVIRRRYAWFAQPHVHYVEQVKSGEEPSVHDFDHVQLRGEDAAALAGPEPSKGALLEKQLDLDPVIGDRRWFDMAVRAAPRDEDDGDDHDRDAAYEGLFDDVDIEGAVASGSPRALYSVLDAYEGEDVAAQEGFSNRRGAPAFRSSAGGVGAGKGAAASTAIGASSSAAGAAAAAAAAAPRAARAASVFDNSAVLAAFAAKRRGGAGKQLK